jgi:hypothetical protein
MEVSDLSQIPESLNEHHLKRLLSDYVRYHHEDRTHLGLAKGIYAVQRRVTRPGFHRIISR